MTNLGTHTKQSVPKGGKIEGLQLWDFEKRWQSSNVMMDKLIQVLELFN